MSKTNKFFALFLSLVMVFTVSFSALAETAAEEPAAEEAVQERESGTMVFATATFGQKFSPFFATTAYDMDVVNLTQK